MNVRCERCQTEYELEDSQVMGGTATVKCTQCGHVFAVSSADKTLFSSGLEGGRPLEGRVRQVNGNTFLFHDLSILQRWIIERKVNRDDEVSLSGGAWSRLGNSPDLATFFLVVEEAQRGLQLMSLQKQGLLSSPGTGDQKIKNFRSRPALLAAVFIAFIAVGAFSFYWLVPHFRGPPNPPLSDSTLERAAEADVTILDGGEAVSDQEDGVAGEPVDEDASDAGAAVEKVPSPPLANAAAPPVAPAHDFSFYMKQADRFREREKYTAALNSYGRASDLSPQSPEPIAGKGLVFLDLGKTLQAEATFQEALKRGPRYALALMGMAETYRSQGKKEQAVHYYENYLEVLPNGPESNVAHEAIKRLKEE